MNWHDDAVTFDCAGERLVGVASLPAQPRGLGLIIVVGGPQYRAGSHRQFVLLARRAAASGFPALRFDYRGMGDSSGDIRSFEGVSADIGAAIACLRAAAPLVQRVAIWGLCDGASAALLYVDTAVADPTVAGLCLVNPWVRNSQTQARARVKHYYWDRFRQRDFWLKLIKGQIARQALRELRRNLALSRTSARDSDAVAAEMPYAARMARAGANFLGPMLIVLSGRDYTAKEFLEACALDEQWRRTLHRPEVTRLDLHDADHTLSNPGSRQAMETHCVQWLESLDGTVGTSYESSQLTPLAKDIDGAH